MSTAILMVSEELKRPQIFTASTENDYLIDEVEQVKLTHRLLYKIGFGQESPKWELGGPITDEAFPESKILFFSFSLKEPKAQKQRIRETGAFSAIFLVFPSHEMNEILHAYDELSSSLKAFVAGIETVQDFVERAHVVEIIVYQSILHSALNQILDELLLDRGFNDVLVITQDGLRLAQASRSRKRLEESKRTERVGAVSALSISEKILELTNEPDQNPIFIAQTQNETIIALKMEGGGIVASLERRAVTFRGKDVFIDALQKASSKISTLLQREAREPGLFSMIRKTIPEVIMLMILNTEGIVLAFENVTGNPHELAPMVNGFYSTLKVAGHNPKEVAVVEGKDSYLLIGELRKDVILLLQVPKRRTLDEYIFRIQDFLQIGKKQFLETFNSSDTLFHS